MSLGRKMMAVKRKPPRNPYNALPRGTGAYAIPGLGQVGIEKNRALYYKLNPPHDGPRSVAGTGAFRQKSPGARRGQAKTRPTPGSANNRRTARWN